MHKNCQVCQSSHATLYWHIKKDKKGEIYHDVFCCKCAQLYSLKKYSELSGISLQQLQEEIKSSDSIYEKDAGEAEPVTLPYSFISLFDPAASKGREYLLKRGIEIYPDMMYDLKRNGIAQIFYKNEMIVGAQVRLITPKEDEAKMVSIKGSRRALALWGWNGNHFSIKNIKTVFLTEGVFDAISIKLAFKNDPKVKVVSSLGCSVSKDQIALLQILRDSGIKVICAFDGDEPGIKARDKLVAQKAIDGYIDHSELLKNDWNSLHIEKKNIINILREGFKHANSNMATTTVIKSKFKKTERFTE